jgi:TonB family protein
VFFAFALALAVALTGAPLPISQTTYDVFGELKVLTEGAAIRIAREEMPPEIAAAPSKDFGADVRAVRKLRGFDLGPVAANAFLGALTRRGIIAPAEAGLHLHLAVHDHGFATRPNRGQARSGEEIVPLVLSNGQPAAVVGGKDALRPKRDPRFFPAVRVSLDLVNARHQPVWTRTATVPPGHPAIPGLSAAQLLGDDKLVQESLRAALALAAADLAETLATQLALTPELLPLVPRLELREDQRADGMFTVKEVAPVRATSPHYAPALREQGIPGVVFVQLEVGEDGRVAKVLGAGGVPEKFFDDAAILAVRTWRFPPATFEDQPVRYRTTQTITFKPSQRE